MKKRRDHALGLLKKAMNDLIAARAILKTGKASDTVCFHAQQAVEKSLKAALAIHDIRYPRIHDLTELLKQVVTFMPDLHRDEAEIVSLTPFAVEIRYDVDFNPSKSAAKKALLTAMKIRGHVLLYMRKSRRTPRRTK